MLFVEAGSRSFASRAESTRSTRLEPPNRGDCHAWPPLVRNVTEYRVRIRLDGLHSVRIVDARPWPETRRTMTLLPCG